MKLVIKKQPVSIYSGDFVTVVGTAIVGNIFDFISFQTSGSFTYAKIVYEEGDGFILHGPNDTDNISIITDYIYESLFYEGLSFFIDNQRRVYFEGQIEPDGSFSLNTDYSLGDVVTVKNEQGLGGNCRILELMYSDDGENGFRIYPTFQKI